MLHVFFFFFKQKTAYEMRISDWSSDVCSSDLISDGPVSGAQWRDFLAADGHAQRLRTSSQDLWILCVGWNRVGFARRHFLFEQRSEEHTSELQSLMRISYAVFCLKKKTTNSRLLSCRYTRTYESISLYYYYLSSSTLT